MQANLRCRKSFTVRACPVIHQQSKQGRENNGGGGGGLSKPVILLLSYALPSSPQTLSPQVSKLYDIPVLHSWTIKHHTVVVVYNTVASNLTVKKEKTTKHFNAYSHWNGGERPCEARFTGKTPTKQSDECGSAGRDLPDSRAVLCVRFTTTLRIPS